MQHHELLIFFALLLFAFGLFSKLAERNWLTGPMVFMSLGILASPLALNLFHVAPELEAVTLVAELALTIVLFTDASLIDLKTLSHSSSRIPARLLLIGLPLTMLSGTVLGMWMFDGITIWAVVLMALILSPTDAALGQAVVKSKDVPDRIRQSISVESGLNDGIALPPILFCLAILSAEAKGEGSAWIHFLLMQVTLGPVVGLAVGYFGGKLIERAARHDWMDEGFLRLSALPMAILAYAFAESVGGNGFIAAFCGGIGLRLGTRSVEIRHQMQDFAETEGLQLILVIFLIFGLAMVPEAVPYWGWTEIMYALASLTVLRMLPVAISLLGAKLDWPSIWFIGWFGPRGIASVLYVLMALAAIGFSGYEQIISVIVLTITISVYVHGLSAVPLSQRFGNRRS
ncbi:cation:proton antiporter [Photobacterium halotolerans]|uniref:Na+/H+ antiporter n=1 Tax=Photobacterium halotolerans TaxID=265726 RepID=A0A0F5VER2_9GAMM|nr:sodium:proton antiporter [Photobacterium halotolerans]KKD00297.1 Na+/H+ antiporter [Photobacterium halotolerans]